MAIDANPYVSAHFLVATMMEADESLHLSTLRREVHLALEIRAAEG